MTNETIGTEDEYFFHGETLYAAVIVSWAATALFHIQQWASPPPFVGAALAAMDLPRNAYRG